MVSLEKEVCKESLEKRENLDQWDLQVRMVFRVGQDLEETRVLLVMLG